MKSILVLAYAFFLFLAMGSSPAFAADRPCPNSKDCAPTANGTYCGCKIVRRDGTSTFLLPNEVTLTGCFTYVRKDDPSQGPRYLRRTLLFDDDGNPLPGEDTAPPQPTDAVVAIPWFHQVYLVDNGGPAASTESPAI